MRLDFEQFAERELPDLLRFATMLTGDTERARDLVQEVMLKAHSDWDRVMAADYPKLYVKAIATKTHLSWRRRWLRRHMPTTVDPAAVERDLGGAVVPDHAEAVVNRSALWWRLAELPPQQRAVLVLRYYEQLTDTEIAQVLGCAVGTVRGYASRALSTLRLQHADDLEPSGGSL